MKYKELEAIFIQHEESEPKYHLDGYICFSNFGSFERPDYTEIDRTYSVSSDNKAFKPKRLGYSVFGSCLNGKDPCVRLEHYMHIKNGWVPGECCLLQYQLLCVNERDFLSSKNFPTYRQAVEAMLSALCIRGSLEYEEVMREFDRNDHQVEDEYFGVSSYSAWLNAGLSGNWDWVIQPVRIYSLSHIEIGSIIDKEASA